VVNPQTHQVEHATATVNSLLSTDGIRFMLTSMVRNFMNFGPVGIILVVMIGVGLAEQAGLINALIKKIVIVTPRKAVTWILVTVGVLASIAADAGYLVLIPLGAATFLSLGRPDGNHQRSDSSAESDAFYRFDGQFLFRGRFEPGVYRW
jgi:aminobenzoyl-glutamate transport protein